MRKTNGHDHQAPPPDMRPELKRPPVRHCPTHGDHMHWFNMTFNSGDPRDTGAAVFSPHYCAFCIRDFLNRSDAITKVPYDGRA